MKHLMKFESFSNEVTNEMFGWSKAEKAEKKFQTDNKSLFDDLKKAEKLLDQSKPETQENLDKIQKELYSKLVEFTKTDGEYFKMVGSYDDLKASMKTLKDIIFETEPFDKRSGFDKIITGSGAGKNKFK